MRARGELTSGKIRGYILLAGVYQFYPFEKADPRIQRFLSEKRYWEEAQPLNHVHGSLSPVFLAHGGEDTDVLPRQSTQLMDRLSESGVTTRLLREPGVGHVELLLNTTRADAPFWNALRSFFSRPTTKQDTRNS